MRKFHLLGLALFAMLAFSAVAAVNASAEGPVWIVLLCVNEGPNKGHYLDSACTLFDSALEGEWELLLHTLAAGEEEEFKSEGGVFVLNGPGGNNIECLSEVDTGHIIGGNPGTDLASIEFLHCFLQGHEECLAGNLAAPNDDTIHVEVQTVLVYPDTSTAPNTLEALDAFFPDNKTLGSDTFVTFTLKEDSFFACLGFAGEVNVVANGTDVAEPAFHKKCGVLAWLGKLNANDVFELTISGEEVLLGAIKSEGTPKEALLEKGTTFELIECLIEVTGLFSGAAEELGISHVDLVSGNEFGWEV